MPLEPELPLPQAVSDQAPCPSREPAAWVIAEEEPRTELLFQNAVFLLEEFKDCLLLLVQPAGQEGDQEELRRDECAHCKAV